MRKAIIAAIVCGAMASGAVGLLVAQGAATGLTLSPTLPHLVPGQSPNRVPADFYTFSWQEFFALNWPAKVPPGQPPERGVPDTDKSIGDVGVPRVWETWKADYETFPNQPHYPPQIITPTPWSSWDVNEPACPSQSGEKVLPLVAKGESVLPGGVNQAMGGPLIDQHGDYVRYEIRLNETEYNEIKNKQWFLRDKLTTYPQPPNLFSSSTATTYGAIELKAAWRIMTPQETNAKPPRFYMSKAYVVNQKTHKCSPQPVTVGLVGFHIAHKTDTFSAWVWSTFEQVDNVPSTGGSRPPLGYSFNSGKPPSKPADQISLKNWGFAPNSAKAPLAPGQLKPQPAPPVEVIRLDPIPDDVVALNKQAHQLPGIKGTVWENYELVQAQWQTAFPTPVQVSNPATNQDLYSQLKGLPQDAVANVTMETYYQGFKGNPPDPARNALGLGTFGTSCLHCHYQSSQYDFSWVLADQAWPSAPASATTFKRH